uniref:DUF262 domain-containing protein n=1 Tax=Succinivibrio sp. TaxID=2053619 RepID=UPI00402AA50C
MRSTNFKTENNSLRKLLGNGLFYKIPRFQRDYSWTLEQWEDLWTDILNTIKDPSQEDDSHYMGYLVLQSTDDKTFEVIDGQQRLTTLTLIILAVVKNLQRLIDEKNEPEQNIQRINQIRQTYIGYLDPVSLVSKSKLTLNHNNNDYFQHYIIPLEKLPQRGFKASEHLLRKSFEWFDAQVSSLLKSVVSYKGQYLAKFVEDLSDALFFTVITVTDELNAYKVFETLNSRGVRLSSTDLLKNYLFSVLDTNSEAQYELDILEKRWLQMESRLQSEKFPDFLRVYWNSKYKLSRHSELFKTVKNNVKDRAGVLGLIKGLESDLDNYLALISPELSDFNEADKTNLAILRMFRVRQPYPLLLSAKRKFTQKEFSSLLRAIVVITFRYNTIGSYSPTDQEKVYCAVAEKISSNEILDLNDVWSYLKPIYIDDERFYLDFCCKSINTSDSRSRKLVRYILCLIEKNISGTSLDFTSDSLNIEHILPQNAPDGWNGFTSEACMEMVYRLGNMVLLQPSKNRDIGVEDYSEKIKVLSECTIKTTQLVANNYKEWSPEAIDSHQKDMALKAKSIWCVSQLES